MLLLRLLALERLARASGSVYYCKSHTGALDVAIGVADGSSEIPHLVCIRACCEQTKAKYGNFLNTQTYDTDVLNMHASSPAENKFGLGAAMFGVCCLRHPLKMSGPGGGKHGILGKHGGGRRPGMVRAESHQQYPFQAVY
jgi:hypothetical protein